jgi:hypothetical protein
MKNLKQSETPVSISCFHKTIVTSSQLAMLVPEAMALTMLLFLQNYQCKIKAHGWRRLGADAPRWCIKNVLRTRLVRSIKRTTRPEEKTRQDNAYTQIW